METQETTKRTNTSIFETSRESTRGRSFQDNGWGERHSKGIDDALMFSNTTPKHRQTAAAGMALMLKGWCMFADSTWPYSDSMACDDYVGGDPWAAIGQKMRALLNYEVGPLDCGTIDSLIAEVLKNEGFDPDE